MIVRRRIYVQRPERLDPDPLRIVRIVIMGALVLWLAMRVIGSIIYGG